jgi:hypothetical protein
MSKHASSVSYSLSGIGPPPHISGCVSATALDLVSKNSLCTFLRL